MDGITHEILVFISRIYDATLSFNGYGGRNLPTDGGGMYQSGYSRYS